ncbi:MAG: hypothetical protein ACRDDX_01775 [Cellulosilyticaceae bacterium]
MKDLFGKIGDSIKNTCKEAIDQTHKTVDQTRYRTEIVSLKNEVKKLYQKLGEEQYELFMKEQTEMPHAPTCNRITALLTQIHDLEQRVGDVVDGQKDSFDAFKRDVKKTWNEDAEQYGEIKRDENGIKMLKFCQHCDIGNAVDAEYCINCGEKL